MDHRDSTTQTRADVFGSPAAMPRKKLVDPERRPPGGRRSLLCQIIQFLTNVPDSFRLDLDIFPNVASLAKFLKEKLSTQRLSRLQIPPDWTTNGVYTATWSGPDTVKVCRVDDSMEASCWKTALSPGVRIQFWHSYPFHRSPHSTPSPSHKQCLIPFYSSTGAAQTPKTR